MPYYFYNDPDDENEHRTSQEKSKPRVYVEKRRRHRRKVERRIQSFYKTKTFSWFKVVAYFLLIALFSLSLALLTMGLFMSSDPPLHLKPTNTLSNPK